MHVIPKTLKSPYVDHKVINDLKDNHYTTTNESFLSLDQDVSTWR